VRSLVDGELADLAAKSDGSLHGKGAARRVAVEERGAAGAVDQRLDVVDLPVHGIGRGVPASAAAAAVVAVDTEVSREQLGQLRLAAG
jgi:hypothetical protein